MLLVMAKILLLAESWSILNRQAFIQEIQLARFLHILFHQVFLDEMRRTSQANGERIKSCRANEYSACIPG